MSPLDDAQQKISGRPSLWPIRWIDLLNEILLSCTSESIFQGSQGYRFPGQRLVPANIDGTREAIEQPD